MSFPRIEGYVVTEKLGSGSYSTVYKAYTKVGARSTVAVKCIDKSRIKHSGAAVDNLVTEIRLLKKLTHPHIVHMKEFTWDDRNIYIIMEYCCGGDLSRYIQRYGRVPEKQMACSPASNILLEYLKPMKDYQLNISPLRSSIYSPLLKPAPHHSTPRLTSSPHLTSCPHTSYDHFLLILLLAVVLVEVLYFLQQLASALKFLREKGVVHMDLKPHNLLLHKGSDAKYILKVADFGFAQHISEETMRSVRGSPLYMAPEMIAGKYDARVDLWSVGVIMYECLFGKAPYSSATFKELVDKIERQDPIRIPSNAAVSPGCLDLLTRLLQHDPEKRISYEEFFSHEYLDLEHMPSKENYDKAVDLIKRAIELDAGGSLADALAAYGESLRYLVPAVGAESDAVRRGALTAKLTRYMERAEEIKAFLKGTPRGQGIQTIQGIQELRAPAPRLGGRCCVSAVDGNSYDFSAVRYQKCPCSCLSGQSGSGQFCPVQCHQRQASNGVELDSVGENGSSESVAEPSKNGAEPPAEAKPRGALARLLRRAPMPYLNSRDDMQEVSKTEKDHKSVDDNSSDMCRIT